MTTLCPEVLRQRLVIEGLYGIPAVDATFVGALLRGLTERLRMTPIADALIFSPDAVSTLHHGVGGFQAWAESGCSLYTWRERRLFTLDVYSCRRFEPALCLDYIQQALHPTHLEWRLV
ncbi:MAG: S-adenosylmethionine decarboxylase [Chromatiaceae bacterium]|nr:S-adenosylmethionine decarboxylase [Gammaproteobacteria bacterium]MCP5304517.1 S-adenosylmethionine decarboxylase [Chromatiaceae bacterium]MCP5314245.1 S-adenosylmethionine decarboxylase [Chromatiaceae bacterium]